MKTLIIYNTVSGYTLKYAQWLKEDLGEDCEIMPLKAFKPKVLASFDRVVFMARVSMGAIVGFKTVVKHAELFAEKYTSVVAVGMGEPNTAQYHEIENANIPYKLKGIPLFCVRGGFDSDKLKGMDRFVVKSTVAKLKKAQSRTVEEMAMLNFFAAKTDKSDREQLRALEDYLESGIFTPPEKPQEEQAVGWIPIDEFKPKC